MISPLARAGTARRVYSIRRHRVARMLQLVEQYGRRR